MSGIIVPMSLIIQSQQSVTYNINTPAFEGPLDLLLYLIERAELDITRVALAQVTNQFVEHVNNMVELPAEEASAFMVIAAKLLQIKSEALLPRPPVRGEFEEDPAEALARQLIIYRKFKRLAGFLDIRDNSNFRTHLRITSPPKVEPSLDMTDLGLSDLIDIARLLLIQNDNREELRTVVAAPVVTIRQKIKAITNALRSYKTASFASLLNRSSTRTEIVVTFLALLELIKRHLVWVQQESLFGEIEILQADDWEDSLEFELEFEE